MSEGGMQDERSRWLDDESADLTDALLRGELPVASDEAAPLLDVARRLDALIAPREAPSDAFSSRLRAGVERAWTERESRSPATARYRWNWAWAGLAAAILLIAVLAIPPGATFPLALSGAAADSQAGAAADISWRAVILVAGLAGFAVYFGYRLRR